MEKTYMPIDGNEIVQLQYLHSLQRIMDEDDSLKPRLQSLGKWWQYRGVIANLKKLLDQAWQTIEPIKRQRINQVWDRQELRIVNARTPVDTTGDVMVVPRSAVVRMAVKLQEDSCGMCLGGHQDRKDCQFRRAMLELAIPDLRKFEKQTGKCLGHIYGWRE